MHARHAPSSRRIRALSFAALALALSAPSFGCQKIKDKIQEKALEKAGVEKTGDGQNITFKGQQPGEQLTFGNTQKIPDGFPADVPIYPGAKVLASAVSQQHGADTFSVTFTVNDPVSNVVEFYNSKIPADAEKVAMANMLSYGTDQHQVTVMINENAGSTSDNGMGKTLLIMTVAPKGPKTGAK